MECNRDEATRAKEIAEKKFAAKDVAGAKKFALKAQSLYPGLEGLPQMLATLDVHLSAEIKLGGEADWYGILGVNPMADDESIKKQYRKLALMLHPDKNKSVGADGAFKLISEAWSFLSDKTKKIYYDQRRFPKASQLKVPPTSRSSGPPTANGFHNVSNSNSNSRAHKTSGKASTAASDKAGTAASDKAGTAASDKAGTAASGKAGTAASGKAGTAASGKAGTPPSGKVGTPPSGKVSATPSGKVNTTPCGKVSTAPSSKVGTSTSGKVGAAPAPSHPLKSTFWTVCTRCKMQYEYLRVYLNHNLLCPHCHEPFLAVETAAPLSNGSKSSTPFTSSQQNQNSSHHPASNSAHASAANTGPASNLGSSAFTGVKLPNQANLKCGAFSQTAGVGCTTSSASAAAQAASGVQPTYDKVGKEHEAIRRKQPVSKTPSGSSTGFKSDPKGERVAKKRKLTDDFGGNVPKQMASGIGGMGIDASGTKQSGFEKDRPNFVPGPNKPNTIRDLSPLELRNMLVEKARKEILKKLNDWKSAAAGTGAEKGKPAEEIKREKLKLKKTPAVNGDTSNQNKEVESADTKEKFQDEASLEAPGVDSDNEASMLIIVPDSDFHDFDKDRCERSFTENEVWAAYDDDDGMPRYYAMIHSVISLKPFKMKIGWLNSKTNIELGPINWIGSGFYKTCGDFRIGKYEVNKSLNSFSHRVCGWTKGTRGAIRIFPSKGDVWALYRNWSPDWNEHTPDEVIHKYDMVEVLDDYNEEHGVSVTPLVKVAGFKTVFHRHLDPREVRMIPREEMFRFSHQVPSYLLTGSEAQNVPDGSRELDPAATPLELLQVITEAKENKAGNRDEQVTTEAKEEVTTEPNEAPVVQGSND